MKVKFTPAARKDLIEIYNYISDILCNPDTASKLVLAIDKAILNLEQFLKSSPVSSDPLLKSKGYRKITVENYLIFYKIQDENIIIMRALYGATDYLKQL